MRYENDWLSWATNTIVIMALAVVVVWLFAFVSRCEAQCAPDVALRSQVIMVEGQEGIWFHHDVAACMLHDLRELALTRERVELFEERLQLRDEQYATLQEATRLGTQALDESVEVINNVTRRAVEAEDSRDMWRWLGLLWGGLGAAAGVVITVLIGSAI